MNKKETDKDKEIRDEGFYWYWLNNIPRIGNQKIHSLLDYFNTPKNVFMSELEDLLSVEKINKNDAKSIYEAKYSSYIYDDYKELYNSDMHFTYPGREDYPRALLDIYDYPTSLYYYGRLPDLDKPTVSIIGARDCTDYGRRIAYEFGKIFASMGIQVISGMALGIDYYGQKGAMDNKGYSLGVLGCGVDICYPRSNIEIYMDLKRRGGIISEYKPQTPAIAGNFPMRNRIISGLSDALVVVEARKKSGTKITVDCALEQGKDVFVVPGRIGDPLSIGCLEILSEGANLILKADDIYRSHAISSKKIKLDSKNPQISKQKEQFRHNSINSPIARQKNMVYSELDLYPCSLDDLVRKTGLPLSNVVENLLELELEGLIEETSKNCYVRVQI